MEQLNLSIIVLSYNTTDITEKCLQKIEIAKSFCEEKLKNTIEIIVLDNHSTDGSKEMIKRDFPKVKLIVSEENTGFSKGNNIAMKQVTNPYILLLNSDVYVSENSIY